MTAFGIVAQAAPLGFLVAEPARDFVAGAFEKAALLAVAIAVAKASLETAALKAVVVAGAGISVLAPAAARFIRVICHVVLQALRSGKQARTNGAVRTI